MRSRALNLISILFLVLILCNSASGIDDFKFYPNHKKAGLSGLRKAFSPFLTINVSVTHPSCSFSNGIIIITASGGAAPYTYSINGYSQNTGYFPDRGVGTYLVQVVDAIGAIQTTTVTLTEAIHRPVLTVTGFTSPTGCNGIDGTVAVTATGGTPPYQYSLESDANYQANNIFSNLACGKYTFYVRDANGCVSGTLPFELTNTCPIVVWGFFYTSLLYCNETGQISILGISGGTAPYQYSKDGMNYQSSPDFHNLSPGIHNIYIRDATGVVKVLAFQMAYVCQLDIMYVGVDAACLQNDGSLTVTASNGTPPYTFTIDGVNYQPGNTFTGLASGNYTVGVKDDAGKTASRIATVYDRCPLVSLTATGESCSLHDGQITATAIKGTPPYQYSIDGINFQTGNVFNGLDAGNYTITLRDALGFTNAATINVPNSCINVFAVAQNSTCGNNNGSITASASNGTAPYQYSLDGVNFQAGNSFTNLAAGPYTVTARDVMGKTGSTTVTVFNTPGPQIGVTASPAFCANNNGSISITGTGGTSPFQYSIDGSNYQSSNVFSNLPSGSYTGWIKDINGCLASQPVTITLNCPAVTANARNETCSNSNGSITATGAAGTAPYQFSIDGINFQVNPVFSGLSAGSYTVTVKDALGAINTTSVSITNVCPTVSATATNGLCGTANASITATGANGTAPYQYSIDGINFQGSNTFSGLANGTYTITVMDANGLTNTTTATVQNFPGPVISATASPASCLNNDGAIGISATGGTSPLQYSIDGSNFSGGNNFSNIVPGNYTATVKDVNGCIDAQPVIITLADNLSFNRGSDITICEGAGAVFNCSSNGTTFNWSPAGGLNNPLLLNPAASPTVTTKYYVTATLGVCIKTDSVNVIVNPAPVANAGQNVTICFGQSTQLNGSGGVVYNWSPGTYLSDAHIAAPAVASPRSSISYSLMVTDANNCPSLQASAVAVTVTPPAKVFAGNDTVIVMNQPFVLKATDINNNGFVSYSWSPSFGLNNDAIQSPVATLDRDMTFTVTATTQQGCEGSDEISVKVYQGPEIYVPTAFSPNADGRNDILRAIPVGIKEFKYFAVFNRWGQQVFHSSDPGRGWDGRVGSSEQDTGVFIWMAEGIDDKGNVVKRKGSVLLVR